MIKNTIKINGMMCGMCESHVCDAIRAAVPSARKVKASRFRKEATFLTEVCVDSHCLEKTINEIGYDFQEISSELL